MRAGSQTRIADDSGAPLFVRIGTLAIIDVEKSRSAKKSRGARLWTFQRVHVLLRESPGPPRRRHFGI